MKRIGYFYLGLLSIIMLSVSILFIGTGRIIYGPDAILIAVMGWMFVTSLKGIIESIKYLTANAEKEKLNNTKKVENE